MDPIGLGLTGIGQGITGIFTNHQNIKFQREENEKNRQFTIDSEARNRSWAETDWNKNNAYNSPVQQMQRLREAGLNPHLIYGKGAENTATMVRSSGANSSNQQAPKIDASLFPRGTDLVMGFASLKKQQAETDNLHQQNALIQAQARAADAQALKTLADAKGSQNTNWMFDQTKLSLIDKIRLENDTKRVGIGYTNMLTDVGYNQFKLNAAKNAADIARTWQEISESKGRQDVQRSTIERNNVLNKLSGAQEAHTWQDMTLQDRKLQLLTSETWIKQAEAKLAKDGMFKSDPAYHRNLENYAAEMALRTAPTAINWKLFNKSPKFKR
jgi:hypothetical protein